MAIATKVIKNERKPNLIETPAGHGNWHAYTNDGVFFGFSTGYG